MSSPDRYRLAAILVVAAAFRFVCLDRESFWLDESLNAYLACQPLGEILNGEVTEPGYPSGQLVIAHAWMKLFGTSDLALRTMPALAGVVGIAAFWWCARLVLQPPAAMTAALLLAINPLHIYLSQEFRTYTGMLFCATASLGAAIVYLRNPSTMTLVTWTAVAILGMNLHYYAALPAIGLFAYVLWKSPTGSARRRWFVANLVVAAVGVTFIPRMIHDVEPHVGDSAMLDGLKHLVFSPLALLFGRTLAWAPDGTLIAGLALAGATAIWGIGLAWGVRRLPECGAILVAALFPALVALAAVVGADMHAWDDRKALIVLPPLLILLAHGVAQAPSAIGRAALAAILSLSAVSLWRYYGEPHRDDWRGIAAHLDEHMGSGDVVLVAPDPETISLRRYLASSARCRADGDPVVGFDVDRRQFVEYHADENRLLDAPPAAILEASRIWLAHDARILTREELQAELASRGLRLEAVDDAVRFPRENIVTPYQRSEAEAAAPPSQ